MSIARVFCALLALLYAALGTWCLLDPHGTAQAVGFELRGSSGLSEYLAVYGGLEWGMALWFAVGAVSAQRSSIVLLSVILIHAPILLVRQWSLFTLDGIGATTWILAAAEIVIVFSAIALCFRTRKQGPQPVAESSSSSPALGDHHAL